MESFVLRKERNKSRYRFIDEFSERRRALSPRICLSDERSDIEYLQPSNCVALIF